MRSRAVSLFLVLIVTLALAGPSQACPFCAPSKSDIVTELEQAQAVARVERVGAGKYKILEVLRGQAEPGRVVLAGDIRDFSEKDQPVVLLSTHSSPSQPYWSSRGKRLSGEEFDFVQRILKAGPEQRLDLAVAHLFSDSSVVGEAAYNLVAAAPLSSVQKRLKLVGRDKLVEAVKDASVGSDKKALYVVMLLNSLGPQDRDWVEKLLFEPSLNPYSAHLPPLIVAYADLGGPKAVEKVRRTYLGPEVSASATFLAVGGLTYVGSRPQATATRQAAREALYRELDYPGREFFVIATLGSWRDFGPAAEVEALARRNGDKPRVVQSVVRYFRSFDQAEAKAALARLQKTFPDIVERETTPFPQKKADALE